MASIFAAAVAAFGSSFRGKRALVLENLALRQQLAVYKRVHKRPAAPISRSSILGVALWTLRWLTMPLVRPETVIRWHRQGFKLYWRRVGHSSWVFAMADNSQYDNQPGMTCKLSRSGKRSKTSPTPTRAKRTRASSTGAWEISSALEPAASLGAVVRTLRALVARCRPRVVVKLQIQSDTRVMMMTHDGRGDLDDRGSTRDQTEEARNRVRRKEWRDQDDVPALRNREVDLLSLARPVP